MRTSVKFFSADFETIFAHIGLEYSGDPITGLVQLQEEKVICSDYSVVCSCMF